MRSGEHPLLRSRNSSLIKLNHQTLRRILIFTEKTMILITGATGFLGSHLVRALVKSGKKVIAVKRIRSVIPKMLEPYSSQIDWREADLLDIYALEEALNGVTQVYHCAAMVSFEPADRKRMILENAETTANLVDLCLRLNIGKLLHVSSVAAIGEPLEGQMATEETIWEFNENSSGYGISKFESEREVWRGIVEGLNAVIVNPSVILGESDISRGSGRIFGLVKKGFQFYTPGATGMISVQDVISCMIALMNSPVSGERFILSSENISYRSFFKQAAEHFGIPAPKTELKAWMLTLAGSLAILFPSIGITKENARLASQLNYYDTSKINNLHICSFTPLKQVIAEICAEINER